MEQLGLIECINNDIVHIIELLSVESFSNNSSVSNRRSTRRIRFISTILGTNSLNCADVPLSIKHTNKQTKQNRQRTEP